MAEISLDKFHEVLKGKTSILAITGAGSSADSGIRTFRGNDDSYWSGLKGKAIAGIFATPYGWDLFPRTIWSLFNFFFRAEVFKAKPNSCQLFFVREVKRVVGIITQNVDGLFQRGGFPPSKVAEIHGTVWKTICMNCDKTIEKLSPEPDKEYDAFESLNCENCDNGTPRPAVTFFNECCPYDEIEKAGKFIVELDVNNEKSIVLLIGTSGMINTIDFFLNELYHGNRTIILIDPNPTEKMLKKCNFYLKETADNAFKNAK